VYTRSARQEEIEKEAKNCYTNGMADFASAMTSPATLSDAAQKKAGAPIPGDMGEEHKHFAETVSKLLESGSIDVTKPESFLNPNVYAALSDEWKAKTDLIIVNIATLLTHIHEFYRSKQTPDACPQLATMIEQLWEMKQRIEVHADVFKF
jgi:hypothetical protein